MSRKKILLSFFSFLLLGLFLGGVAYAQNLGFDVGEKTGLGRADIRWTASQIIRTALSVLGIVTLVIILYAGFLWMTAGGNDDKVAEAKKWLSGSVIGLIIILAAYSITLFVTSAIVETTTLPDGYTLENAGWDAQSAEF